MANIPGSVRVAGFIAPSDTEDLYPTHDSQYGKGGYREVADLEDRDAIPNERRKEGMAVWVISESKEYRLVGGITNSNWVANTGGSSYTHPATHPATMIEEDSAHRFVSDAEKVIWSGKQNAFSYTPENVTNKGALNGYAPLVNGKVPEENLPTTSSHEHTNKTTLDKITENEGLPRWNGADWPSNSESILTDELTISKNSNNQLTFACGVPNQNQQLGSDNFGNIVWEDKGTGFINQVSETNLTTGDDGINPPSNLNPKTVVINIPYQTEFRVFQINVLKVDSSSENVISTQIAFDAGDVSKFEADPLLIFDGTVKLKTSETVLQIEQGILSAAISWYKSVFNNVSDIALEKVEVI